MKGGEFMKINISGIICCLLLLAGLSTMRSGALQAEEPEKALQGVLVFSRSSGLWLHSLSDGKETKLLSDTKCESPRLSPSGDCIVFTSRRDRYITPPRKEAINGQIYVFDRKTGRTSRLLTCPDSDCQSPVWSADGKEVAFGRANYKEIVKKEGGMTDYRTEICIADAKTGKLRIAAKGVTGYEWQDCMDPVYFDNGSRLVYFYSEPGVREPNIISMPDAKKIQTEKVLKGLTKRSECCFLAFSGDGRYVALTEMTSQSIFLMERATGVVKELTPFSENMGNSIILHSFSPDSRYILCSIPVTDDESRIFIISLEGRVAREIGKGKDPCWGKH
jgi:Tol biopolymer transport system component